MQGLEKKVASWHNLLPESPGAGAGVLMCWWAGSLDGGLQIVCQHQCPCDKTSSQKIAALASVHLWESHQFSASLETSTRSVSEI